MCVSFHLQVVQSAGRGQIGAAYPERPVWTACDQNVSWIMAMHVITRKRLNDFAEAHPESGSALQRWYHLLTSRNFDSFAELREIFPEADQVGRLTVFNVGGNKVRLIAAIHYIRRKVYIRAVLTHEEYGKSKWKE